MARRKHNTKGNAVGKTPSENTVVADSSNPKLTEIDALQLVLDLVGMVPGAGAVADVLNTGISVYRGDFIGAFLNIVSAVPGAGDIAGGAKIVKNAGKYLDALKVVEKKVLPKLPKKLAEPMQDFINEARNKITEMIGGSKVKPKKTEAPASAKSKSGTKDNAQVKDGKNKKGKKKDCKALEGGTPGAKYKGGKYGKIKNGGKARGQEAHHMPADAISPKSKFLGPAIQMDYADHRLTASCDHNNPAHAAAQESLVSQGKAGMMAAIAMDIADIRGLFGNKYDSAIAQMVAWAKCMGYV